MSMRKLSIALSLWGCLLLAPAHAQIPRGSVTIDRIAAIKYPASPAWSPDGAQVAFLWDDAGKQDLFVVTPGQAPRALTDYAPDPETLISDLGGFLWLTPDQLAFVRDGALYAISATETSPRAIPIAGMRDVANVTISRDRKHLAFTRGGQIWTALPDGRRQRPVTNLAPLGANAPVFSPDGQWIAFTAGGGGAPADPAIHPFNGDRMRVVGNGNGIVASGVGERRLGVASVYGDSLEWIPVRGNVSAVQFTAAGELLWSETSEAGKVREIKVAAPGGMPRVLWRDYDEKWFSPTGRDSKVLVSPDGESVAFVSDRTGWIHIYVMPTTGAGEAKPLTSGDRLAGLGAWSPDSRKIGYHYTVAGNQMERFIGVLDVATGESEAVVSARGVSFDPAFSPDGSQLVFHRTDVENSLDLYVVPAQAGAAFTRLSDSMPPGLDKADLTPPVPVSFPSRLDGQPVPATLMVADHLDLTQKHPALVWIHGSGSDQNYLGWHPGSYRMYYSLCQYLAQQGYVIITPDYRGSSGYSRDWATGVHMGVGVNDTADVASSADYLKTLAYVDPDRIGVFGLSYGGFLTLQAMVADPTLWRAGIDVAGVVDWATYGAGYTTPRLGTPVQNPEIYDISAPINHMAKLERPLLVLHGANDRNVSILDSLRLFDVLIKLGKSFESQIYPGEVHFFRRAIVLRDAWKRIEEFFDRHLKAGPTMRSE